MCCGEDEHCRRLGAGQGAKAILFEGRGQNRVIHIPGKLGRTWRCTNLMPYRPPYRGAISMNSMSTADVNTSKDMTETSKQIAVRVYWFCCGWSAAAAASVGGGGWSSWYHQSSKITAL